jgi:polyisoprenoid-binding protein YceI
VNSLLGRMTTIVTVAALPAIAFAQAPAPAAKAAAPAGVETWVVDRVHSEASFQVRHFVSKVRGRFTDFEGTIQVDRARPEASTVEFKIKATSIDTDNERRDGHLRTADFFDVATYPEITFKSSKVVPRGNNAYDVTGAFSMHGVTREITVPVTFLGFAKDNQGGEKAGFEATAVINRKDFGMTWNQALDAGGVVLGDEVQVSVNIEANRKPGGPAPAASN